MGATRHCCRETHDRGSNLLIHELNTHSTPMRCVFGLQKILPRRCAHVPIGVPPL